MLLLVGTHRHVRAVFVLLDTNAELVFLKDAQALQLGGDVVQGVEQAHQLVHLSPFEVRDRGYLGTRITSWFGPGRMSRWM
jgi:hypothetical protein